MPLYLVRRTDPFRNELDVDAAIFRTLACAGAFPGLTWIRSFYNDERKQTLCIYEADSKEDVKRHSFLANVPYDSVVEVRELTPDLFRGTPRQASADPARKSALAS